MNYLAEKFREISGVAVPAKYFNLKDGKLLVAPYGSQGIEFDQNGVWKKNDGEIFHIGFLADFFDVMDAFGEVVKNFAMLEEIKPQAEEETMEYLMEESAREDVEEPLYVLF